MYVTQSQAGLNSEFLRLVANEGSKPILSFYLPIAVATTNGFMAEGNANNL